MITPMKQLDLLLFHEEKETFLEAIREAGVVHITEDKDALSKKGTDLQSEIVQVDKVLTALPKPKEVVVGDYVFRTLLTTEDLRNIDKKEYNKEESGVKVSIDFILLIVIFNGILIFKHWQQYKPLFY